MRDAFLISAISMIFLTRFSMQIRQRSKNAWHGKKSKLGFTIQCFVAKNTFFKKCLPLNFCNALSANSTLPNLQTLQLTGKCLVSICSIRNRYCPLRLEDAIYKLDSTCVGKYRVSAIQRTSNHVHISFSRFYISS